MIIRLVVVYNPHQGDGEEVSLGFNFISFHDHDET
jgi:hypothetical protein